MEDKAKLVSLQTSAGTRNNAMFVRLLIILRPGKKHVI